MRNYGNVCVQTAFQINKQRTLPQWVYVHCHTGWKKIIQEYIYKTVTLCLNSTLKLLPFSCIQHYQCIFLIQHFSLGTHCTFRIYMERERERKRTVIHLTASTSFMCTTSDSPKSISLNLNSCHTQTHTHTHTRSYAKITQTWLQQQISFPRSLYHTSTLFPFIFCCDE